MSEVDFFKQDASISAADNYYPTFIPNNNVFHALRQKSTNSTQKSDNSLIYGSQQQPFRIYNDDDSLKKQPM